MQSPLTIMLSSLSIKSSRYNNQFYFKIVIHITQLPSILTTLLEIKQQMCFPYMQALNMSREDVYPLSAEMDGVLLQNVPFRLMKDIPF